MYEILPSSAGNVLGIKFSGKLTHAEYKKLNPVISQIVNEYGSICLLLELDHFQGWEMLAALDDILFKIRYHQYIEKLALVTDSREDQWAALLDHPFGRLPLGREKIFKVSELEKAWDWINHSKTTLLSVDPTQYKSKIRYGAKMRILIVGNGTTGLTLANLLQQRGFAPTVIAHQTKEDRHLFQMNLWPEAARILQSLNLASSLERYTIPLNQYEILSALNKPIVRYSTEFITQKYGPVLSVEHARLRKCLLASLNKEQVAENTYLDSFEQSNDAVEVLFSNGCKEKFDVVVGCDGPASTVRKMLFGKMPPVSEAMLWYSFIMDKKKHEIGHCVEYWSNQCVATLGVVEETLHVVLGIKTKLFQAKKLYLESPLKFIQKSFESFPKTITDVLRNVKEQDLKRIDYRHIRLGSSYKGRIVLIGDAAFSTLPSSPLGVLMAIESAYVLAEELTKADSCYISNAFEKYQIRRNNRMYVLQDVIEFYENIAKENNRFLTKFISSISAEKIDNLWDQALSHSI